MSQLKTRFIEDAAVTEAKVANAAISEAKIANNAVTTAKLIDSAVSTDKLANGAVTSSKIGSGQVQSFNIQDGAVIADKIPDGSIVNVKIANDAIGAINIINGEVTNAKLAAGIEATKIADGSVSDSEFQFLSGVTSDIQTQLDAKIPATEKGANNGVATLDAGGKIPAAQLPNTVMEFKGQWNASTNSPTLADGTGDAGDVYRVEVAGTQNLGSGSITFDVGDWVMYSGTVWQKASNSNTVVSVNGQQGVVVLDSDDVAEGATNLYFTDERAQDAVGSILSATAKITLTYNDAGNDISADINAASLETGDLQDGAITTAKIADDAVNSAKIRLTNNSALVAASSDNLSDISILQVNNLDELEVLRQLSMETFKIVNLADPTSAQDAATKAYVDAAASGATNEKQLTVLAAGDITNQYIDLSHVALTNSIDFYVRGGGIMVEGASYDYSVSYTGGAGGNTRITFLNNLATGGASALVAGDVIVVKYQR